jgi:uncharacterized protein (TIGR03663 family)
MQILATFKKDKYLWGILFIAAVFRFLLLSHKTPHFDEGIVGWWVDQIIATGYYPYDPTNYHGPLPYYLLFFSKLLFGRSLWAIRLPGVLFGMGAVYVMTQFDLFLGKRTAYIAALFIAVSPAMAFYSRYTPHEGGLLFFSLLTVLGFLRFSEYNDDTSLWLLGIGAAGMMTTKETFLIHVVCMALALLTLRVIEKFSGMPDYPLAARKYSEKNLNHVLIVYGLIMLLFYTGFFVHWAGVLAFFRSFVAWFHTGTGGNGHDKPFFYWLQLFSRYEWAALAGLILSAKIGLPMFNRDPETRRSHWLRLFAIYGAGTLLAYSIIPYKTPWCVIQLAWPFFILTASFISDLSHRTNASKLIAGIGIVFLSGVASAQSIRLIFFHDTDHLENYVYVQTYPEIMDVDQKLRILVDEDVNNYHFPIKIYMDDTWPLAWLWADFTKISWMGNGGFDDPDAPLVLADLNKRTQVESHFKKSYYFKVFRLRDAQGESIVYFEIEKFKRFFDANEPVFHGSRK